MRLKELAKDILFNVPGFKTKRRIIVFESDDWGSIRVPSKEVYHQCIKEGYDLNRNAYSRYDTLASNEDLDMLFNVLVQFKDLVGNHPIFTANCLMANPDFKKIKESGFSEYYFEPLGRTLKRYPNHDKALDKWKEAMKNKIFMPQFHGREHLNVHRFMKDLKAKKEHTHFAFNHEMPGIFSKEEIKKGNEYVVALEHYNEQDLLEKNEIVHEGLRMFENEFGFKSKTAIACNYVWSDGFEKTCHKMKVDGLQGQRGQLIPKGEFSGFKHKYHYCGQKNSLGLVYTIRNVMFEPSSSNEDHVNLALKDVENAFKWNKPAIISSHRVNYVGGLDICNRDHGLKELTRFLREVQKRWPEVEFMSSSELVELINRK